MSSSSYIPTYMATVLPGLEDIAGDEITRKILDAKLTQTIRGKIFFTSRQSLESLMNVRTIDNLYLFIDRFVLGPHKMHLKDLENIIARVDLSAALDQEILCRKGTTLVVNASRAGKHTYSRFELSEAAVRGIIRQRPHWNLGTPDDHELEFRIDVSNDQALFSFRLTPAVFRFRGNRFFSQAALRPTVAHALVWISNPRDDESFLDPFCGSGTIIAERAFYPAHQIAGGDISAEAVAIAKQNIPGKSGLTIKQWDARNLPLDAGSIDTVITNLPFGQQILGPSEVTPLYLIFFKELQRVLVSESRAFLLTDKVEALEKAADKLNFRTEFLFQLSLKGLHPSLFQITKY